MTTVAERVRDRFGVPPLKVDWENEPEGALEGANGWLSPSGEFYACDWGGHDGAAKWLLEQFGSTGRMHVLYDEHKWMKVSFSRLGVPEILHVGFRITNAQWKFIERWCDENDAWAIYDDLRTRGATHDR